MRTGMQLVRMETGVGTGSSPFPPHPTRTPREAAPPCPAAPTLPHGAVPRPGIPTWVGRELFPGQLPGHHHRVQHGWWHREPGCVWTQLRGVVPINHRSCWSPSGAVTHLLLFPPVPVGNLTCSCWMCRTCVPGQRAGWCSMSRPPAATGQWIRSTAWGCGSTWRQMMVSLPDLPAVFRPRFPGTGVPSVPWDVVAGFGLSAV